MAKGPSETPERASFDLEIEDTSEARPPLAKDAGLSYAGAYQPLPTAHDATHTRMHTMDVDGAPRSWPAEVPCGCDAAAHHEQRGVPG